MSKYLGLLMLAMAVIVMGCNSAEEGGGAGDKPAETKPEDGDKGDTATTKTALENDLCATCGCCAGCDDCCDDEAEKCTDCKMQKGTELCCKGLEPSEGVYCKACGYTKDTEDCCKEGAEKCTDCNLAKGSPLCCKLAGK